MVNIFRWLLESVFKAKKHSQLSESIKDKISEFLTKFFPQKSPITIRQNEVNEVVTKFDEIKQLVIGIKSLGYFERHDIGYILTNLSSYYFNRLTRIKGETTLSQKEVSEIINGLMIVKHIVIHRLERKHKDILHALEGIALQAEYILAIYFHESVGSQINGIRMQDLRHDFEVLVRKIDDFKKIAKKVPQEYEERITRFDNLIKSLHTLIFELVEVRGLDYIFSDKRQIVDKLKFCIETVRS